MKTLVSTRRARPLPALRPANDPSNWPNDSLVRRCDCGNTHFYVYLIDNWPRLVCDICEMDHTEVFV